MKKMLIFAFCLATTNKLFLMEKKGSEKSKKSMILSSPSDIEKIMRYKNELKTAFGLSEMNKEKKPDKIYTIVDLASGFHSNDISVLSTIGKPPHISTMNSGVKVHYVPNRNYAALIKRLGKPQQSSENDKDNKGIKPA